MQLKKEHEDFRGEIWTLTDPRIGEMTLLFTKAGYARGGCVHDQVERFILLDGEIELNGMRVDLGQLIINESDVTFIHGKPHYFKSLTDSVVLEIKPIGTKTERDPIMRKKVQEINDGMEKSK
jgi:hypothetical protein